MWWMLAFASGALQATQNALEKKSLGRGADRYFLAAGVFLAGGLCASILMLGQELPTLSMKFWLAVVTTGVLNVAAFQIQYHTMMTSEFSLVMPMLAFSPAFNIVMARLIIGDHVSPVGIVGVFIVVAGSYLLHTRPDEPLGAALKRIAREPSARNMLAVALIFSVSMPFNKMATQETNPSVAASAIFLVIGVATLVAAFAMRGRTLGAATFQSAWPAMLLIGAVFAGGAILEYKALTLEAVPYVMSIKRLSIPISIFYGWLLFKERFALRREIGGAVMFVGHAVIIIGS